MTTAADRPASVPAVCPPEAVPARRCAARRLGARVALLLSLVGAAPSVGAQESAEIAEGVVLHRTLFAPGDGVACYRIPALVTAPNGDLLAAIDQRVPSCADLRGNPDVNVVVRRSEDGGETWSEIETVVDYAPGISASDPSLVVDRVTGRVFLFYNVMDLDGAPGIYRFHVQASDDGGRTWGEAVDITSQITHDAWRDGFVFITSGRGIQTASGTLLHTLVNVGEGAYLFGSDDHGASWFVLDTPLAPGDESKVVELDDGAWMVNSRVNGAGVRYTHVSSDRGATWQTRPEAALPDPGSNASLIRYPGPESRLLFANANSAERRENLTVRQSEDGGRTWTDGRTVYAGGAAYSSLTVLDDGDIGILFEKDDYAEVVFVRFSPTWLTNETNE